MHAGAPRNAGAIVYLHWDGGPTGGGYEETIYLLLRDGTAYEGLAVAPEDFNAEASKQQQPSQWYEWRQVGSDVQIRNRQNPNGYTLRGRAMAPGRADERLSGTYTNSSGSVSPVGGYTSFRSISFRKDGGFSEGSNSTMSTGGIQAVNGAYGSASHAGSHGGTYRIDGYRITLRYADGRTKRLLFAHSDSEGSINVGGTGYTKEAS